MEVLSPAVGPEAANPDPGDTIGTMEAGMRVGAQRHLGLRHQLQVALRTNPHPRLHGPDRVPWVWIRRLWPNGWRQHLHLVRPETVLRSHRKGWRLYWTCKS